MTVKLTKAQQESLKTLWLRRPEGTSYLAFRRSVTGGFGWDGVALVRWCGMTVGIERDGYRHT